LNTAAAGDPHALWQLLGVAGGLIFYGRFYVQWITSELQKRSVIPIVFWYMSTVGSLMLLAFAVVTRSPIGSLGQCLNIVIYARNLVHIWREKGKLSRGANWAIHAGVGLIALGALALTAYTWLREYQSHQGAPGKEVAIAWIWIAVGLAGQVLFAGRFLLQWAATEVQRKSVVPTAFWYLSIAAATLQCVHFAARQEWVFAVGLFATILIYVRNLWFIHRGTPEAAGDA
jgi:lipid-A-disaccharide synthase-like uncharacterized protein